MVTIDQITVYEDLKIHYISPSKASCRIELDNPCKNKKSFNEFFVKLTPSLVLNSDLTEFIEEILMSTRYFSRVRTNALILSRSFTREQCFTDH